MEIYLIKRGYGEQSSQSKIDSCFVLFFSDHVCRISDANTSLSFPFQTSMSANAKFETFWTALNSQCPYDLPAEIKPFLEKALGAAGFHSEQTVVVAATGGAVATVATKTKKLSGYNLFMREKMAELKTQNVPSGERMTKVSVMWKALKDEEKATWKVKADGLTGVTASSAVEAKTAAKASTGPKKLSGYQLYVRETMVTVKANTAIAAKERMAEIGKMWKALKEEERVAFKAKTEKL